MTQLDSALGELQEWIDKGVVPLPTADNPDAEVAWDECTGDQLVDAWVQYKYTDADRLKDKHALQIGVMRQPFRDFAHAVRL